MATLYLDLENGNDAADGTSYANRKKTWASVSSIAAPGDTVRVMGSPATVSLGVNGTWVTGDYKMTLSGAVNADIDTGEVAWTASANVTATTSTTRKEGATSSSIAIAAGFTTGLAAYKALGGATDFSGYQQISFWIQQSTGTLSGNCSIRLCSDAAGATPVDTLTIPAMAALNAWHPIVIDKGSALGASIQSVAIYVDSDQGAQTFLIDNIIACKAPATTGELTHQTLIGKANSLGAGGTDADNWYAIRSIRGTTIQFDLHYSSTPGVSQNGRYFGTTETITSYSQKLTLTSVVPSASDNLWITSGTPSSHITISGGWNRTDMSTQTLQTWYAAHYPVSGVNGVVFAASNLDISRLHAVRWQAAGILFQGTNFTVSATHCVGSLSIIGLSVANSTFSSIVSTCTQSALSIMGLSCTFSSVHFESDVNTITIGGANCNVTITSGTVCGGITNSNNNSVFIGSTLLVMDSDLHSVSNSTSGVSAFSRAIQAITIGTVTTGASTTSIPTSSLSPAAAVADQFKGQIVCFDSNTTTATLRGVKTDITASTIGGTLTVSALPTTPVSGDTFTIQ